MANRSQYVQFENCKSESQKIECGVPQGSILGPLLYLLYVNDIANCTKANILSFADDTSLFVNNSNITELYEHANTEIQKLFVWFCSNRLSLNAKKTKYLVIKSPQQQCDLSNLYITINEINLERIGKDCKEQSTKFLGVYIDENLSWKAQISHMNIQISRSLYMLKQVKHCLPMESLRTLYYTLIHPHITYGILAWGRTTQKHIESILKLHKKAIRVLNKANYNSHTDPLYYSNKVIS